MAMPSSIGCSSNILAHTGTQRLTSTSPRAVLPCLPAFLGANGDTKATSRPPLRPPASIRRGRRRREPCVVAAASDVAPPPPASSSGGISASDVVWPSAGAFLAMAVLGRMDQMLAWKGVSLTIAPLGAVCCVLFTAHDTPAAKKYNMFVAQIGCAACGVLAFTLFGPGWLARGAALAACLAFMTITGASHPPAASLPLLFIDGPKFHDLQFWYALFPGAAGCVILCLIQEVVVFLKKNYKF